VLKVAETGRHLDAEAHAAAMQREQPGAPWAEFAALAAALAEERSPEPTTVPRSEALLPLLGHHSDALVLRVRALLKHARFDDVVDLARAHPDDGPLQAARVSALFGRTGDHADRFAEAVAAVDEVEGLAVVGARLTAARWLRGRRPADALAMVEAALQRSPRAVRLHALRWRLLHGRPGQSDVQRREAVNVAIAELLAVRGGEPAAWSSRPANTA
jgi:hypothetical protein